MKESAKSVFYSRNHFIILPMSQVGHSVNSGILQFLTQLPINARQYLQNITWVLPDARAAYPVRGNRALSNWHKVIDICATEINLSQLGFTLDMSLHSLVREADAYYSIDEPISYWEEQEWAAGLLMVEAMAKHKGWRNFYVHLSWPWNSPDESLHGKREAMLEQQVMGDKYDSISSGKLNRRHRWNGYNCGWHCKICDEIWDQLY
jgi:hypothetical protein